MLAAVSDWRAGVEALCAAGADREARDPHTGSTALYLAATHHKPHAAAALLAAGADPDAPNYWGVTPRRWLGSAADHLPVHERPLPPPHIQDAEHLADQHHPNFKIPTLDERLKLRPGQVVTLYVYGPRSAGKQDDIKVRITSRRGVGAAVRYEADVETPIERTHLAPGTRRVEFGPKNVASIYYPKPHGAE
jgi:hypothetical protein